MLPRHHHEFFLRSRPYRGEPPTVAGFLLYPDTPASMETTSQEAFCFRPVTQQLRDKGLTSYLNPDTSCCRRRTPAFPQPDNIGINPAFRIEFSTVQRETYSGWPNMSPSRPADTIKHDI
ncbi:uncharacterized protein si:dkeyp-69c1.9 isoform X2 [Mugil cephalus]|uniref:uncharacterized protein si:dkeyp-69c1.9 isoform X2 n=1 Tax=Mugil cephalus TaxID=48193 RepID=UPI001FB7BA41|nr:uncharacterized protein si:dkeyp-69c1.9 isoform X2 [Mugil cephalus]